MDIWYRPVRTRLRQRYAHLVAHRFASGSARPDKVDTLTSIVTGLVRAMGVPCVTSQHINPGRYLKFSAASVRILTCASPSRTIM